MTLDQSSQTQCNATEEPNPMKVLILSGPNHGFEKSAPVIGEFLRNADDLEVSLEDQKDVLT